MIYDVLVVGGGPGGLTAGIYGSRARLKTAVIEKGRPGGQAATTMEMENYPGFYQEGTSGPGIMDSFAEHAKRFGTQIFKGTVTEVELEGPVKKVKTANGEVYESHCVILSPGAEPRTLNLKGEGKLRGKGVSYCATCDADFFEDLDVVVVGNGDAAIEEAMYLTKFAESVTIIVIHDEGILDCNKASAEKAFKNKKLKWVWSSVLDEIVGDELVEAVKIKNIKTNEITELEVNGVFFFIGTVPKTAFLEGKVELNQQGYIVTNELMETNVPGVYGVGDATAKYLRQVVTAAADGAIAAVAAEKYLAELESFRENVLESPVPVLLAFWAPQVEASIAAIAELEGVVEKQNGRIGLAKLDTYRNKKTSDNYKVKDIPTVILFNKGEVIGRIDGAFTARDIETLIQKI
ncbi:MAG: thioredoxin-disulfide reductase [Oscillospiraceae bacterium]|nr:thioredoxin-disulfide reductase [Oscillospiraceae bacterium]